MKCIYARGQCPAIAEEDSNYCAEHAPEKQPKRRPPKLEETDPYKERMNRLLEEMELEQIRARSTARRVVGWIILLFFFSLGLLVGRATAAEMYLSAPQHDYGITPMRLYIDLDPGETYDLFRVHLANGNVECRSIEPGPVQKLEWKMNEWPYHSYASACGTWDTWSSIEMRIYAGFWQENPIHVTLSGAVISFDWIIKRTGDTPCIGYAHLENDGVRTLLPTTCLDKVAARSSTWSNIKEMYR